MSFFSKAPDPMPTPEPSVSKDQFDALSASVARLNETFSSYLEFQQRPAVPMGPPPIEEVSDEEIDRALSEGRGAASFRKMVQGEARRQLQGIAPMLQQGIESLSHLSMRSAGRYDQPYAKEYAGEIEKELSRLPVETRANPTAMAEAWNYAYGKVLAGHIGDIQQRERETAIRQATAGHPEGRSGGRVTISTPGGGEMELPSLEDVVGGRELQNILRRHGSADGFARSQGFDNWAAFAADLASDEVEVPAQERA